AAGRDDAIRLRVGDDHGLVDESGLPLQNGQDLVIDGVTELACLSGLAGQFNSTRIHGKRSFRFVGRVKGTSRILRGDHWLSWNATNLLRLVESVNCPESVQPESAIIRRFCV